MEEEPTIKYKDVRKMFNFMSKDWFIIVMNIIRIATFVLIAALIIYMLTEITALKILNYDACQYCMDKTGAICTKVVA